MTEQNGNQFYQLIEETEKLIKKEKEKSFIDRLPIEETFSDTLPIPDELDSYDHLIDPNPKNRIFLKNIDDSNNHNNNSRHNHNGSNNVPKNRIFMKNGDDNYSTSNDK